MADYLKPTSIILLLLLAAVIARGDDAARPGSRVHTLTVEQYAKLYADLSVEIAKVGREQLGWLDGQDPRGPAKDRGRGVSNWQAHYSHALHPQKRIGTPALVQERMRVIQQRVSPAQYATLYATVSVIIAKLGKQELGWFDGPEPNAPSQDPVRGISNRDAHYNQALASPANARRTAVLVGERMSTLKAHVVK